MSNALFALFLLLSALNVCAEETNEPACRREGGRVSCSEAGFKTLTDALIDYRGAEEKWVIRHQACVTTRESTEAALVASEAARKVAEDKLAAIKPPSVLRPVLAVSAAIVGGVAASTALLAPVPNEARWGLGVAGLAGVITGFVFVLPERMP